MKTCRVTMAQALVGFLKNQYVERDGQEHSFFAGAWGIFGHGIIAGVGQALQEKMRTGLSQNYLADFSYDERTKEMLLLEVEPKEDASGERWSSVVVRPME